MLADIDPVRREFPTLERGAHFATAHEAPLPRCVEKGMQRDYYENAGRNAFDMERVEEAASCL